MKSLLLGLALLALSSSAVHAGEPTLPAHDFPHVGSVYHVVYANSAPDGCVLRVLKVLPNGWIYATRRVVDTEAAPQNPEQHRSIYKDATPQWFNLQAFAQATEIEAK